MGNSILNIYCPDCGAPAEFDIVRQIYACRYCGGKVTLEAAKAEKSSLQKRLSKKYTGGYALETTSCTGCGATVMFAENEALSTCEFCGRSLVRKRYTGDAELPQYVVPFGVTYEEAQAQLTAWCDRNSRRPEAKHLREKMASMKGYYLPYEMIRGPVHCTVCKRSEGTKYQADGYLNDEFINCSAQLDNLLLDAMEPFDLNGLEEFDFAYVAGHRVKTTDLNGKAVTERLHDEAEANYTARFEKMWGTKSLTVDTAVQEVVRLPVLLPVYYITDGEICAAVNGQTGKVSVRAEKDSAYLELPWWLKGILVLLLALGATFSAAFFSGYSLWDSLYFTGALGLIYLIVFPCMLADGGSTEFGLFHYRQIFSSGEQTYHREAGHLVLNDKVLQRRIAEPFFRKKIGRKEVHVTYAFRSVQRRISAVLLALAALFFPVILALFVNGFDFARLDLSGSIVWFCITLPTVPVWFVRFGIQWLYENPWVYVIEKDGSRRRLRKKIEKKQVTAALKTGLRLLFVPPVSLAVWLGIACMATMVYLTAFGV